MAPCHCNRRCPRQGKKVGSAETGNHQPSKKAPAHKRSNPHCAPTTQNIKSNAQNCPGSNTPPRTAPCILESALIVPRRTRRQLRLRTAAASLQLRRWRIQYHLSVATFHAVSFFFVLKDVLHNVCFPLRSVLLELLQQRVVSRLTPSCFFFELLQLSLPGRFRADYIISEMSAPPGITKQNCQDAQFSFLLEVSAFFCLRLSLPSRSSSRIAGKSFIVQSATFSAYLTVPMFF